MTSHSQLKAITVWGKDGPNPPKVHMILAELGLPHEVIGTPISDVKTPEYLAVNPNGRLPSIRDPNTGITLWESGAIVEYLIEQYDTEHKISFAPGTPESYHAKQWLFFQTTGQGPYYGQLSWFKKFHAEKLPSAIERYAKEVNRVSGVLEGWLAQQEKEHGGSPGFDGPWLVGNKLSYADFAFVSWQIIITFVTQKGDYDEDNFPQVKEWLGRLTSRESVKEAMEGSRRRQQAK
jgi:glutathione S-transferase